MNEPDDNSQTEPEFDDEAARRGLQSLAVVLKERYCFSEPRYEEAFFATPRHLFLPGVPWERVYTDEAITTQETEGHPTSSCSQPIVVQSLLELLDPQPGESLLEIGAGTGWAAALAGHLVLPSGRVTTIDISEEVAAGARANLASNGSTNIEVITGDGGVGYAPNAPYDAVLATVGVWDIAPAWLDQLKVGGRLVLPFWFNSHQFGIRFDKVDATNTLEMAGHCGSLGFMRLRGPFAGPESFYYEDDYRIDSDITDVKRLQRLVALLNEGARHVAFPAAKTFPERSGFSQYLALINQPTIGLQDNKERHGFSFGSGLVKGDSLVVLPTQPRGAKLPNKIAAFGSDEALDALMDRAEEWKQLGQPSFWNAHIVARPLTDAAVEKRNVIRKRWMEYEIGFAPRETG